MPLTKPRCAKCDYNLRDTDHTLACPECGHPDRVHFWITTTITALTFGIPGSIIGYQILMDLI